MLCALMLLFGAACAESIELAASPVSLKPLERFASWTEEDNLWRVYSNETAAALNQLSAELGGASVGYFYLELSGDRAEGVTLRLTEYYGTAFNGTPIGEDWTMDIPAGAMTLDFELAAQEIGTFELPMP